MIFAPPSFLAQALGETLSPINGKYLMDGVETDRLGEILLYELFFKCKQKLSLGLCCHTHFPISITILIQATLAGPWLIFCQPVMRRQSE